jgi:ribosomal protein S18 acetylase RimI-like enzyme
LPAAFDDPPNMDELVSGSQASAERQSLATARAVRSVVVPRLVVEAVDRGWWRPFDAPPEEAAFDVPPADASATILRDVDSATWAALIVAARVVAPADPRDVHVIVQAALAAQASISAAVVGATVVGLVLSVPGDGGRELLALGVAPAQRRRGLGTALLEAHIANLSDGEGVTATFGVAERDPVDPLPVEERAAIARGLLSAVGFEIARAPDARALLDPNAIVAVRG